MRCWALLLAVVCLVELFVAFAVFPWVLSPLAGIWAAILIVAGFLGGLPRRQSPWATESVTLVARILLVGVSIAAYMAGDGPGRRWLEESVGLELSFAAVFGVVWPLAGFWFAYKFGLAVSRLWRGRVPQSAG